MKYETEYFFYPFIFHRLEHISEEHQHLSAAYSDITDRYCVPSNILIFFLNNTKKCKIQKSKYIDTADWNKCWIFISFFHRSVYANLLIKTFFYRYESSQKTLLSLKQELKTLTEMHEILQKHNESLKQQHDL